MSLRVFLIALLIAIALWAGSWLSHQWLSPPPKEAETTTALPRGYYLRQAHIRQTTAEGAARYDLQANYIAQDPRDERILLDQVTLNYQSDVPNDSPGDHARWQLQADHGWLSDAEQRAAFNGHVLIEPVANQEAGTRPQLSTDSLQLDLRQQLATTQAPVTLRWGINQLTARGLTAHLNQQTLKLSSQVRGVFHLPEVR